MNYRKLLNKLIDNGYLEAEEGSKLHRVGLKVAKKRNQQARASNENYTRSAYAEVMWM